MIHATQPLPARPLPAQPRPAQPRAQGRLALAAKDGPTGTRLAHLRASGALRALFPRPSDGRLQAIVVNTAGGITGGDALGIEAAAGCGAHLSLTTQAAERAYRAQPGSAGRLDVALRAGAGARLDWLPQETILYDGCDLRRTLEVDLAGDAAFTLVEALVLGRAAMGETLRAARLHDRVSVRRDGAPVFRDGIRLSGDVAAGLAGPATAGGARAIATVLRAAPDAASLLGPLRARLPSSAGASAPAPDLLFARLAAPDAWALRQALLPVVALLTGAPAPRSWTT